MNQLPLNSIEIENFRAFDHLTIERLGQVNLIIGQNNVGKSTLLEAIRLYANMGSIAVIEKILQKRGELQKRYNDRPFLFDLEKLFCTHFDTGPEGQWCLQIGEIGLTSDTLKLGTDFEKKIPVLNRSFNDNKQMSLRLDVPLSTLKNQLQFQEEKTPFPTLHCVYIDGWQTDDSQIDFFWENIALSDSKKEVIRALNMLVPEVEDFALNPSEQSFFVKLKGATGPIPIKRLGDGANRLLGIGMALACAKDGTLLIDEIENGLHWSILPQMWEWIGKVAQWLNVQVFATTHSADCLKGFYEGAILVAKTQGQAIRLEKRKGKFHAQIFDSEFLATVVTEGGEIR